MEKHAHSQQCQQTDAAWKMICELRQEIREAQKIRAQIYMKERYVDFSFMVCCARQGMDVIGIKIAFVSTAFGFVFNAGTPTYNLLLIPAFAAIFFDYLIISYGYSIKRIGYYCRYYLEPKLRIGLKWPSDDPLWEESMNSPSMKQYFATTGNLGISFISTISAIVFITSQGLSLGTSIFLAVLLAMFGLDLYFCYGFKYTPVESLSGKAGEDGRWKPANKTDKMDKKNKTRTIASTKLSFVARLERKICHILLIEMSTS